MRAVRSDQSINISSFYFIHILISRCERSIRSDQSININSFYSTHILVSRCERSGEINQSTSTRFTHINECVISELNILSKCKIDVKLLICSILLNIKAFNDIIDCFKFHKNFQIIKCLIYFKKVRNDIFNCSFDYCRLTDVFSFHSAETKTETADEAGRRKPTFVVLSRFSILQMFDNITFNMFVSHKSYDHKIVLKKNARSDYTSLYKMFEEELKIVKKYLENN
jgi:hypothetical protein